MTEVAPQRRLPRKKRQESILAAAVTLFGERSFEGVGMRDLAAACEVSATAIYRHFPNKDAVLIELYDMIGDQIVKAMRSASRAGSPPEVLASLIHSHVKLVLENPRWIPIYQREMSSLPPAELERIAAAQQAYINVWTESLLAIQPKLSRDVAHTTAVAALAAINSAALGQCRLKGRAAEKVLTQIAERCLGLGAEAHRDDSARTRARRVSSHNVSLKSSVASPTAPARAKAKPVS